MIAPDPNSPNAAPNAERAKTPMAIYGILILTVVVVILSWRSCSYLVPLTDSEVTEYLASDDEARIHRALSQVDERIVRGDPDVEQFFPRVVELSEHESAVIREPMKTIKSVSGRMPTAVVQIKVQRLTRVRPAA